MNEIREKLLPIKTLKRRSNLANKEKENSISMQQKSG